MLALTSYGSLPVACNSPRRSPLHIHVLHGHAAAEQLQVAAADHEAGEETARPPRDVFPRCMSRLSSRCLSCSQTRNSTPFTRVDSLQFAYTMTISAGTSSSWASDWVHPQGSVVIITGAGESCLTYPSTLETTLTLLLTFRFGNWTRNRRSRGEAGLPGSSMGYLRGGT